MADTPDIWPGRWPEPPAPTTSSALAPVRPIGDRAPRFGVAHELDVARNGAPVRRQLSMPPRPVRKDRSRDRLRTWWACREVHPADLWHRMQCHFGRHRVEGGQRIQLGGRFVNTERCCVWCGFKPR